jgi:hypothetical protein
MILNASLLCTIIPENALWRHYTDAQGFSGLRKVFGLKEDTTFSSLSEA